MGATGAMIIAIAKRRLSLDLISQALDSTAKLSAFVVFILVGARVFSLTFYGVDGTNGSRNCWFHFRAGRQASSIFTNVMVFLLAFFLDFFELAFIVVPLLGPPAEKLGIDLIWFGVILGVNMQTSFMHPPFGFALFYLRSVAPEVQLHATRSPARAWSRSRPCRSTGRGAIRRDPVHHGRTGDHLPADGDALQRRAGHDRSGAGGEAAQGDHDPRARRSGRRIAWLSVFARRPARLRSAGLHPALQPPKAP